MFVKIEIAKLLKIAKFKEPCMACYDKCDVLTSYSESVFKPRNYNNHPYCTSVPTYDEVGDWFRKKYGIHIEIYSNHSGWGYILTKLNGTTIKEIEDDIFFEDYYKAFDKGIEEAIKLVFETIGSQGRRIGEKGVMQNPDCDCEKVDGYCCNLFCRNFWPV